MRELTPVQLQLAKLIAKGLTYDEISAELKVPRRTVIARTDRLRWMFNVSKKRHLPEVMRELGYFK